MPPLNSKGTIGEAGRFVIPAAFLQLDTSSPVRWNVIALILTVLIMILFVGGTLWIMYHLNYRLT